MSSVGRDGDVFAPSISNRHLNEVQHAENDLSNPLRDAGDRRLPRIAGPCGLVIFGVTGDLSRKKLMPAIYDLANRGLLPPGFALVGFARRDWADQDFEQIVHESVKEHARTPFREEVWQQLAKGMRFIQGEFVDDAAFDKLRVTIEELDKDTRWAVQWFGEDRFNWGEAGKANLLANAQATAVNGLVTAGILEVEGNRVRLISPERLPADWDPEIGRAHV